MKFDFILKSLEISVLIFGSSVIMPITYGEVSLPRVLGSHMVLQQSMPVPIWGRANPGEKVSVEFDHQTLSTVADCEGNWRVDLAPLKPGSPKTLTIRASNTIVLEDVLVGEVWVGSGQSNLDTFVYDYTAKDEVLKEAAQAEHPNLRIYHSTLGGGWRVVTPETLRTFSAQLFYLGVVLEKYLHVPVGLMMGAVRGDPSGRFLPKGVVENSPEIQDAIQAALKKHPREAIEAENAKALEEWEAKTAEARQQGVAEDELPKKPWMRPLPGTATGKIGNHYAEHIKPMQPYAIRGVYWDQGEGGTDITDVPQSIVMKALIRAWRHEWGQGDFPWVYVQKPSNQGCALDPENPINLGCGSFEALPKEPRQNPWDGSARLEYIRTADENPNTYVVPASDLCGGIHPWNKSGYGTRGAQVILGSVYHLPVSWRGPVYQNAKTDGNRLVLTFETDGYAITHPAGQQPQGFSIAGVDKKFYWANVEIEDNTITLTSPIVDKPVAARYGWSWDIQWANIFNESGLPLLTFRTDNW